MTKITKLEQKERFIELKQNDYRMRKSLRKSGLVNQRSLNGARNWN
jgi:hypothetical protein